MSGTTPNSSVGLHLLVGFQGTQLSPELKAIIKNFQVGGIVLFRRNIETRPQLLGLIVELQAFARETLGRPLWLAIDQEGGPVQRLAPPFTLLPSARELANQGEQAIIEWTTKAARDLKECGIQINLAPVLDVPPPDQTHFMTERCLGPDSSQVAQMGKIWIETLQKHGISATAKHYPGLGRAESDPHHFAPVIRWNSQKEMEEALHPFRTAVKAGVHCIMTSHARYPALDPDWPATLASIINREWLRNKLLFQGVLLSDDLDMAAVAGNYSWPEMVRRGLEATIDFFLVCQHTENIERLYESIHNAVAVDSDLAALHQRSLKRIERLFAQHQTPISLAHHRG